MDPFTLASLGEGAFSLLGGLINPGPDYESIYGQVKAPTVEELIAAGQLGPSAYEGITEDPATRNAQMSALSYLQNLGREGGMDLQARAAQQEAMDRVAQQERSSREAVLNNMAMRGMRGSGAELAAQLQGGQSAMQANAMAGTRAAADARTRALQAMTQAGQLGGQVRGQDYGIASDKAAARDAIARFNANNKRSAYGDAFGYGMQKANAMANAGAQNHKQDMAAWGAGGALAGGLGGAGYDWWREARDKKRREALADNQPGIYSRPEPL